MTTESGARGGRRACRGGEIRRVPPLRRGGAEVPRLDARDELHVRGAHLAGEETVDVQRPLRIEAIDHGEGVEFHALPPQQLRGREDLVERGPSALGHAVGIVQVPRSVDAQAHQEAVLAQEPAPGFVQQHAVGLQIVFDPLARLLVLRLKLDHLAEKIQSQQRGLAALPGEDHAIRILAFDVLADELLQQVLGDAPAGVLSEKVPLAQVIAILAVQVAGRADGLDHGMEAAPGAERRRQRAKIGRGQWWRRHKSLIIYLQATGNGRGVGTGEFGSVKKRLAKGKERPAWIGDFCGFPGVLATIAPQHPSGGIDAHGPLPLPSRRLDRHYRGKKKIGDCRRWRNGAPLVPPYAAGLYCRHGRRSPNHSP